MVELHAQLLHHLVVSGHGLQAAADLLHHDGGGAHHLGHHHDGIVGHLVRRDQFHVAVLANGLDGHELAHIRVSPAAGAQHRGAQGHILDFVDSDKASHNGTSPSVVTYLSEIVVEKR